MANFPGQIGSVGFPKLPHVSKRFQRRIAYVHEPDAGNAQTQIPGQGILNKNAAVECLVGETTTSATETVALPETEQHTATSIFKMP